MPSPHYQRFAISIPAPMATQIEEVCKVEGRNRSEFFREAVRFYMNASRTPQSPQFVIPANEEERKDNPFRLFAEWGSQADAAQYGDVSISELSAAGLPIASVV